MEWERGCVVRSRAGRDKDCFLAVLAVEDDRLLVADGKSRPIERPKRKNVRHVAGTLTRLDEETLAANGRLRRALAGLNGGTETKQGG
jgi:ribosomal protein L14E/L6E/L27E